MSSIEKAKKPYRTCANFSALIRCQRSKIYLSRRADPTVLTGKKARDLFPMSTTLLESKSEIILKDSFSTLNQPWAVDETDCSHLVFCKRLLILLTNCSETSRMLIPFCCQADLSIMLFTAGSCFISLASLLNKKTPVGTRLSVHLHKVT